MYKNKIQVNDLRTLLRATIFKRFGVLERSLISCCLILIKFMKKLNLRTDALES